MTEKRSLRHLAVRSASWTVGGRLVAQALRLVSNVIVARLLYPEAFGLMAIVAVFLYGLNMFSDLGIGTSIVQNERGEEESFRNTAWTIQIARGVIISIGAVILAWPVALIYEQPQLVGLLSVAGLAAFIQGFQSTAMYTQQRQVELGPVVRIEIASQVVTLVVVVGWALITPTVWALVGGTLVGAAVKTVLSHVVLPDFPHRLHWDSESARAIYHFGIWIFLSSIFTFIGVQGDRLLLGYYLGMALLGVYSVATRFTDAITMVQNRLTHFVFFPVLSETARSEPDRLVARYYKIRRYWDFSFVIAAALLSTSGHRLIELLYDERYQEAGWILQLLAIRVAMSGVLASQETLLFAKGRTVYGFARSFARSIWILVGIPLTWNYFGLHGVVWCVALSEIPVLMVLIVGMVREQLLRPLLELRSVAVYLAALFLGRLVEGFLP